MVEDEWWKVMDRFNIRGSSFEFDVKKLSRLPISPSDASLGTLSFIVDRGISQKALWLLPFFEHLIIKCGSHGVVSVMRIPSHTLPQSSWANERTDFGRRMVVAHGSESVILRHFPPETIPQNTIVNTTGAGLSHSSFMLKHHV
jgi:pseudouridylate synthase / pseudouridine kinase